MNSLPFPDYMGRITTGSGTPQGTCFQIAPYCLLTAWHVVHSTMGLDGNPMCEVRVDGLGDTAFEPMRAWVVSRDIESDLALLRADAPFPRSARLLSSGSSVPVGEEVDVAGHAVLDGVPPHEQPRWLEASGQWHGEVERNDGVRLARLSMNAVAPGMSGAPVRRRTDGVVLGVLSARYNTIDSWFRDSIWVARTTAVHALCQGRVDLSSGRWTGPAAETVITAALAGAGYRIGQHLRDKAEPANDVEVSPPEPNAHASGDVSVGGGADSIPDASDVVAEAAAQAGESAARRIGTAIIEFFT